MIDADYIIDNFIKKLYQRTKPSLAFKEQKTKKEFCSWQKRLKDKIRELLGEMPKAVTLKPDLYSREEKEKYIREKWVIQSEKDCYVPLYLLIPKGIKKAPAILCCHGHNDFAKDNVAGVTYNQREREKVIRQANYNYGEQMAEKGFISICPDWRSFGERVGYTNPYAPRDKCNIHFIQHLILGETLLGANIFDGMRVIDFLLTRKEVDKKSIGCMGVSFGGTMTTYITLLDERIKAATCFYLHSARKAHRIVKKAYKSAEAEDNLWIEVFPGEHSFSGRKAFDFFKKYL